MLFIIGAGNHRICIATLDASKEVTAGLALDVLQQDTDMAGQWSLQALRWDCQLMRGPYLPGG